MQGEDADTALDPMVGSWLLTDTLLVLGPGAKWDHMSISQMDQRTHIFMATNSPLADR